jgi:CRP-like cAMP-binding protein
MKISKKNYPLENCYLSKHSIKEWLPAIEANKKVLEFKKGDLLFKEGDLIEGIYFVYEGNIKVHKKWGNKELILRIATAGSILGHRGLSTTNKIFPISATALENGAVAYIPIDFFKSTLKVNPDFTIKLLMFFADELQESEKKMRNLAHMSVKGRLCRALLSFKTQFGINENQALKIELSKQDISSYVGATYETLFRILNELIEDKAILVDKRSIRLINEDKLIEFSKEEE